MIEASSVTFGYASDAPIVNDWSEAFGTGELVAITGPSGRGKSTVLYILGLMLGPTSGRILFRGQDVTALPDASRARLRADHFGFVFQDAALDGSRTVLDNIVETALYRGEPRAPAIVRAIELMEQFGVELRASAKPGQVSGGQAQRIALCRALLNRPSVVLADEPTGNLDPQSALVVMEALRERARSGAAVVIVTHDPNVVARCDRKVTL